MSKSEQVKSLTRGKLVLELARHLIDFGDDGVIIELARELGYEVEKKNHQDWIIHE